MAQGPPSGSASSIESASSRPRKTNQINPYNLPLLPMELNEKKKSIAITWTILVLMTSVLVEFLYFVLRYGAKTSTETALTVPTAILAVFSILTIGFRTSQLLRKSLNRRPAGGVWWECDYFNWNMIIGFGVVTGVLAAGTGEDPPNIRQASLPQAIVLYLAGSQLVITGAMNAMGLKTPIRLSSTSAGGLTPPGVYVLMEDVVAVDGGGGQSFREALTKRYEASSQFRKMVVQLNWFWGVGSILVAVAVTVLCYAVDDLNVVFALGWCLPWVWAALGTVCTIFWAKKSLRREHSEWGSSDPSLDRHSSGDAQHV